MGVIFIFLISCFIFNIKKQKTYGSEREFFSILKGTSLFLMFVYIFVLLTCFLEKNMY